MEPHLEPGIAEERISRYRIFHRAPAPVVRKDCIVDMLDTEFHLRHAQPEHPVDMLPTAPVGPGLERNCYAADWRKLIFLFDNGNRDRQRGRGPARVRVHRLNAPGDELLLILHRPGGHRATHHNQLHFVHAVAENLKLSESRVHLPERIVPVLPGAFRRRFLTGVALRGMERVVRPARAGKALAVGAGSGRGHHSDRRNTGERPARLDNQDLPQGLTLFRLCNGKDRGVLRDHGQGVFPADRDLRRNNCLVTGRSGEDEGDHLPERQCLIHDRLMFGCNFLRCSL